MIALTLLSIALSTVAAFSPSGSTSSISGNAVGFRPEHPQFSSFTPLESTSIPKINLYIPRYNRSTALRAAANAAEKQRQFTCKKRIATFMAFMTGWADFLVLQKYKFFPTMMTGNTMWLAKAFFEYRFRDVAFYVTVITAYLLGVGTFRRAELSWKNDSLNGFFAPIVAGGLILSDFLTFKDPAARWIPALILSFCWAIINGVGSEVTGNLVFVVTGAFTRLSNMIVDRISRTAGRKKIQKDGIMMALSVIFGFFVGALWSVFLDQKVPQLKSCGAFGMMGVIYGTLFLWLDREELGAWWNRKDGALCDVDEYEGICE